MIAPGSRVVLKACPGSLKMHQGETGVVYVIDQRTSVAVVNFNGFGVPVPLAYLIEALKEKQPRRSPLNLSIPPDDRDEATRLADGARDLLSLPSGPEGRLRYSVMRVGQGSSAAICAKCSRLDRERGGKGMVKIFCKDCGSGGITPSTNSTEGVPDALIFRADWPKHLALMCEWKDKPTGARTKEQKILEAAGRVVVVWDTPSFFEAIYQFERVVGIAHHPQLVAWLEKGASRLFRAE